MSMLTPPGMGGKYRITGDRYPRMRRPRHRRRIILGLVAGACALGLVGWGSLQLIDVFGGRGSTAQAAQEKRPCPTGHPQAAPPAARVPAPASLTVNVYNATPRSGLAKRTADELRKRGFRIGNVGNAPAAYDKKVGGPGILLGPRAALSGPLKVLATQLAGAQLKTDDRKGSDLDLVIGTGFSRLTAPQDAARALDRLSRPARTPAPATC
ncbi:LytR C-terminal domain-containing protein [Streptomyces sp. RS10V-4]|uniref:LytR C-terminal domain-containing protein n=1 Tax=Streptomyces rhizoryzae TaxID=2932493 RepID=UPI002006B292|nr:LytR C-terminal domain-containing protein [Streptomyces rhizoryzae]MCK7626834.1 LytR C-terminal domain-containing protein [Streptomyces rhizoryzae]